MEHAGHAAHAPAKSVAELRHPPHGSYEGHVVPGVMFIIWSTYWLWSVIDIHLRSQAPAGTSGRGFLPLHSAAASSAGGGGGGKGAPAGKAGRRCCSTSYSVASGRGQPFRSRAWYPWPYWNAAALEPLFKLVLPLLGVLVELYIGWGGWRPLYAPDGHFAEFHANNWQHALMYGGVAVSGAVDLIGLLTPLPAGTEQAFLSIAFLVETLLMGLHAKPNHLDQLVHTLLTSVMVACVAVTAAEIAAPTSLLLALLRGMAVMFQGTWFWHVGAIMFRNSMAWDMDDMGSVMFVPVVFSLHMLLIALGTLSVFLGMRCMYVRLGITPPPRWQQQQQRARQHAASKAAAAAAAAAAGDGDDAAMEGCSLLDVQLQMSEFGGVAVGAGSGGGDVARVRDARKAGGAHLM